MVSFFYFIFFNFIFFILFFNFIFFNFIYIILLLHVNEQKFQVVVVIIFKNSLLCLKAQTKKTNTTHECNIKLDALETMLITF